MRYYKVADEFELTFNLCVRLLSSFNRQISFYSPKVDEIFYNIIPQLCCNLTLWPLRLIVMAFCASSSSPTTVSSSKSIGDRGHKNQYRPRLTSVLTINPVKPIMISQPKATFHVSIPHKVPPIRPPVSKTINNDVKIFTARMPLR